MPTPSGDGTWKKTGMPVWFASYRESSEEAFPASRLERLFQAVAVPTLALGRSGYWLSAFPENWCGFGWLCPAVRCWKLDVGCWMFGLYHKHPEYNSPPPPPSGWSGGALVPPWYLPIPIEPPPMPFSIRPAYPQASPALSRRARSSGSPAAGTPPHRTAPFATSVHSLQWTR